MLKKFSKNVSNVFSKPSNASDSIFELELDDIARKGCQRYPESPAPIIDPLGDIEDIYESLSKEIKKKDVALLDRLVQPVLNNELKAEDWCRNIAYEQHISEWFSATYLKKQHGIVVQLHPEPDLKIKLG